MSVTTTTTATNAAARDDAFGVVRTKRMRVDDGMLFVATFEQLSSLKQLVDVVGSVLERVYIELRKKSDTDDTLMLSIDTIDPQHVCVVQAQLVCNGHVLDDETRSFCINLPTLTKCLRNLPSHHSVEISMRNGSADVSLRSYDAVNPGADDITFDLHTYDEECEKMPLDDLSYEFQTDMDMPSLRRVIKLADSLKCERMEMALHTHTDGKTTHAITEFSGDGEAVFRRSFPSLVVCDGESATTAPSAPVVDRTKMTWQFTASFSLDYLNRFVRAMEHQMVNIKLGRELPLTIQYPLGIPDSRVCFVLAPKTDE